MKVYAYGGVDIAGVVTSGEPTPGLVPVGVFRGRRTLDFCFLGPPVSPRGLVGAPASPRGLGGALPKPNGAARGETEQRVMASCYSCFACSYGITRAKMGYNFEWEWW